MEKIRIHYEHLKNKISQNEIILNGESKINFKKFKIISVSEGIDISFENEKKDLKISTTKDLKLITTFKNVACSKYHYFFKSLKHLLNYILIRLFIACLEDI